MFKMYLYLNGYMPSTSVDEPQERERLGEFYLFSVLHFFVLCEIV
jgi:hypothetical protein